MDLNKDRYLHLSVHMQISMASEASHSDPLHVHQHATYVLVFCHQQRPLVLPFARGLEGFAKQMHEVCSKGQYI